MGNLTTEEKEARIRKAAGLVKLLALAPQHRLHRERATDLHWPVLQCLSQGLD